MKALIPAAGLGSRFLPATKAQPKEMLLVVDKPAIQYVVEEGLASGADEVIIINSRDKKSIEAHFTPDPDLEAELRSRGKDSYADKVAHAGSLNVSYVTKMNRLALVMPFIVLLIRSKANHSSFFLAMCLFLRTTCSRA